MNFDQKNHTGAMMVLQQMQDLDIKPDSETYSYLISNSANEEDIAKVYFILNFCFPLFVFVLHCYKFSLLSYEFLMNI